MRKVFSLFILILVGLLVSCTSEPVLPRLSTPTGITVTKNVISFNPVEGADKYVLNINKQNVTISFTQYTISEAGNYTIQVKAVGKNYRDSLFSTPVQMTVAYLNYPTDIKITNNVVDFTPIPYASSYNIEIDGIVYNTAENPPVQLSPGTYMVRVQALSNIYINSPYSPLVQLTVDGPSNLEKLDTPTNVTINKNRINFDVVPHAERYIVNLDGTGIVITDNVYVVTEPGEHKISVKAAANGYLDSDFTVEYDMFVGYLTHPTVVEINQGLILFTMVENADSYNIDINGAIINTESNSVAITTPGTYTIKLQAISSTYVDSPWSPSIQLIVEEPMINTSHSYRYSHVSNFDLPLYDYAIESIEQIKLEYIDYSTEIPSSILVPEDNYVFVNKTIYLKADYLDSLTPEVDPYEFILTNSVAYHQIFIKISQDTTPYVYSDQTVTANMFTDVIFKFETFGAELKNIGSIADAPIVSSDYVYQNGMLRVKNSYITKAFEKKPSLEQIQLLCVFNVNGDDLIVPLVILK